MRLQKGSGFRRPNRRRLLLHTNSYRTEARFLVEVLAHLSSRAIGWDKVLGQEEFIAIMRHARKLLFQC